MSGHVRRFGIGAGLVGGTVAVALTLAMGGAHANTADQLAGLAVAGGNADSTDLLVIASTNFLDAKDVFTAIDTSDVSGDLLSAVEALDGQSDVLDRAVSIVDDQIVPAESSILANSGSMSELIDQLFFAPVNQQWADAGESMLTAMQAFGTAIADGSLPDVLSAEFQILGVNFFQVIPAAFASIPVVLIGSFFDDTVDASDLFDFSF